MIDPTLIISLFTLALFVWTSWIVWEEKNKAKKRDRAIMELYQVVNRLADNTTALQRKTDEQLNLAMRALDQQVEMQEQNDRRS